MSNEIATAATTGVESKAAFEKLTLDSCPIVKRRAPTHINRLFFLFCSHQRQWQWPLLWPVDSGKAHFKNEYPKSLAQSPASPEPELPLDCGV